MLKLLPGFSCFFQIAHPDQLGQSPVHGVNGNRRGSQLKPFFEAGDPGEVADASQEEPVGRKISSQQRHGPLVEPGDHLGGPPGLVNLAFGYHRPRGKTFPVRIGVRERPRDPASAEYHHKAVGSSGPDNDLRLTDPVDGAQFSTEGPVQLRVYAAGSAVGYDSLGIEGTEVGASSHIADP